MIVRSAGRMLAAVSLAVVVTAVAGCGDHRKTDPGASRSAAQGEQLRERALSQRDR